MLANLQVGKGRFKLSKISGREGGRAIYNLPKIQRTPAQV